MTMATKTVRFTLDLPNKEHKKIRTMASVLGLTMKDLFLLSVEEFAHKKLNKTTIKALEETAARKGLYKFDVLQDMFDDLGI